MAYGIIIYQISYIILIEIYIKRKRYD